MKDEETQPSTAESGAADIYVTAKNHGRHPGVDGLQWRPGDRVKARLIPDPCDKTKTAWRCWGPNQFAVVVGNIKDV